MKFGIVMNIRPPEVSGDQKNFLKIEIPRWRTAAILKIEKLRYLQNRLADFD